MNNLSTELPSFPANATLTTRMHDILEDAIIRGELAPGQRIHADALAAEYGMSRIPVREALRSLHEAGWVDIKPRHGVHVRERTAHELEELFQFRAVVEGVVARWAAERRGDEDLRALTRIVQGAGVGEAGPVIDASTTFYAALRRAACNSVLSATSAALEKRARFYFYTVAHQLGEDWRHVHEQLLEAISVRDAAAAESLAAEHIEDTGRAVRQLLFAGSEDGPG